MPMAGSAIYRDEGILFATRGSTKTRVQSVTIEDNDTLIIVTPSKAVPAQASFYCPEVTCTTSNRILETFAVLSVLK